MVQRVCPSEPSAPPPVADDRLRLLLESIRDYAIFMIDTAGLVQTWNPGAERLKGYSEQEILGQPITRFYTPEDAAAGRPQRLLREAAKEGRVEDEGVRVRKDGTRFWADVVISAVRDHQGRLIGFSKVTRDLSERRAVELALRSSEERFRLMIEAVKDYAIFMLDPDGTVATWNAGAERINGYRRDEILGRHFSVFYPEEDVRAGKCEREIEEVVREGRFEEEAVRVRKDGTRFPASIVITALRDPAGRLLGFAKVTRDLTDKRRAEEERLRLAQADEAIRLRDEFLSIASHELKTPLTALQLQLQGLSGRQQLDPKIEGRLTRAKASAQRLGDLVETLFDVGRISTGQLSLHRAPADLAALARDIVDGFQETAERARSKLICQAETKVTGIWDRLRVEQVLVNLLSNALKYGAGQPVTVSVGGDERWAVLEVKDRGAGIPPLDLERIFGRFERAVSQRHYGGLGLGLFVAREIVQAHGGVIEAHNEPEGGARLTVRLPR